MSVSCGSTNSTIIKFDVKKLCPYSFSTIMDSVALLFFKLQHSLGSMSMSNYMPRSCWESQVHPKGWEMYLMQQVHHINIAFLV